MKVILITISTIVLFLESKAIQLHYGGKDTRIILAVKEANKILQNQEFTNLVNQIEKFDNTQYSGKQILSEMSTIQFVEVTEFYKSHTKTTAKTQNRISINKAKLNRSLASITNTLIHECIHAVDWLTNKKWDYTHRTQHVENPPISAPYVIGSIAQKLVKR